MARLNKKRQADLEPLRMVTAIKSLKDKGYEPIIPKGNEHCICFQFKDNTITYFPYSGWASGKGIKAGRGLKNLLKQLN